jgi:Methyltransferase domain
MQTKQKERPRPRLTDGLFDSTEGASHQSRRLDLLIPVPLPRDKPRQDLNPRGTGSRFRAFVRDRAPAPVVALVRRLLAVERMLAARARMTLGRRPLSVLFGADRGRQLERYYLDRFLDEFAPAIHGHCLEFGDDVYTRRYGGDAVGAADIIHVDHSNPRATIVADLTKPNRIPTNTFDCIVCTYVLHVVFDVATFVAELHRILKPNSSLLVAAPFVGMWGSPTFTDMWRFTPLGLQRLLNQSFGSENVTVRAYGNSLTSAGNLRGLVIGEFTRAELDYCDWRFALEVCAHAVKPPSHFNPNRRSWPRARSIHTQS